MPAQAVVTLIVGIFAVIGVIGVVATVNQRTRADNRAQSWLRITWCLERTVSADQNEAALGWELFGTVAATPFIARTDRDTLETISDRATRAALAEPDAPGDTEEQNEQEGPR